MSSALRTCFLAAVAAAAPWVAQAQGFAVDYSLARFTAPAEMRLAPGLPLGGGAGAGLQLQAGAHWFGQVGVAHGPVSAFGPPAQGDVLNLAGGYRWSNGQSLSLQLSRGRGPGERLGLAVNYDWPRYFVRLSYDQGLYLTPTDHLRFSAGVRF